MLTNRIILLFIFSSFIVIAQAQIKESLEFKLDSISKTLPALNKNIDFTVNDIPLHEFIRGVANEAGLNVNLDMGLNEPVSNNFTNVQVKDLLVFVQKNYNVNIEIIGNILNISRILIPDEKPISSSVLYNKENNLLTLEANNAPIHEVLRVITEETGVNIASTPTARNTIVNSYIKEMQLESALHKLAIANNLSVSKSDEGFYVLDLVNDVGENASSEVRSNRNNRNSFSSRAQNKTNGQSIIDINVYSRDSIDVNTENADLQQVLQKLFDPLNISYQVIGEVNDKVSTKVKGVGLKQILEDVFAGLSSAIREVNGTYWIGARDVLEMQEVRMVQMRYRSIDSLQYIIPENLKADMEIIDYPDMNSLIIAGAKDRIQRLQEFLKEVDKLIPVILIEVIIIDNNNSKELSTGISAGLTDETVTTSGNIFPSTELTVSSNSINKIVEGINGAGWVNLGKVKSNFYMTLNALDENGYVNVRSTPQLATMNGHKATMSIGRTEYYKEELNTLYGSVTSSSQTTTTYKPVEAELKIDIKPIISGNQDITLQISVEQSDFTDRIEENAPPGKVSRKFDSMIRIKDQEMILLGGLEEAQKSDTRRGFPLLSRVPVINLIFSSKSKSKSEGKLNIFIKPSIIN
ncbi:type II secretion system protein GspD [Plebeiibacterium sediminum]|uniref:Type II/III secretion system secretin-like domain-containing protein n=1 Tax=Plebeiibacterium sediminum TaxID=2992112 RepID=A0AAE3SH38_9BACT|nr:hypothetical protein [Plebeiobacterium sediminum]MCW3787908.1 hypothetical protein [Plebeiobacterium sediminum]